jgi:hypothetical protein
MTCKDPSLTRGVKGLGQLIPRLNGSVNGSSPKQLLFWMFRGHWRPKRDDALVKRKDALASEESNRFSSNNFSLSAMVAHWSSVSRYCPSREGIHPNPALSPAGISHKTVNPV